MFVKEAGARVGEWVYMFNICLIYATALDLISFRISSRGL